MRIEYVCHATLRVETDDAVILTDPWLRGPAYCGQWHLFPRPVAAPESLDADCILVSHGHEDHLHEPTLRALPGRPRVFFPYGWYGGVPAFLRSLGYERVTEAVTYRTCRVGKRTRVTYVANNLDSIVVVESGGRVLVNANDALHAHHPRVIDLFVRSLRRRWPRIDVLFCGFGGASSFPNAYHMEGKDDVGVARLREEFLVTNFCRIVAGLRPRVAVPFAADFVLLEPEKRWINDVRFPRERLAERWAGQPGGSGTEVVAMYPGDVLEDGALRPRSPYRAALRDGRLDHLVEEQHGEEIARRAEAHLMDAEDAERLFAELAATIERRAGLFSADALRPLAFAVRVTDAPGAACLDVRFPDGRPALARAGRPAEDAQLVLEAPGRILRYAFASEWGGDALTIGYGCDVQVRDAGVLRSGADARCVHLVTNLPAASRHLRRDPLRMGAFLLTNPLTLRWALARVRGGSALGAPTDRDLWLTRTPCDICRACDIPLVDDRAAARL